MKSVPFHRLVCTIILAVLGCHAAETNKPDCVGVRLGMSITEARERLKSYDPALEVQTAEVQIPELGEKPRPEALFVVRMPPPPIEVTNSSVEGGSFVRPFRSPAGITNSPVVVQMPRRPGPPFSLANVTETIQIEVTLPPNQPVVWKVVRSLRFEPGREQAKSALVGALRDKYGKESQITGFGTGTFFWVLRPEGSPLEGPSVQECSMFCQTFLGFPRLEDTLFLGTSAESLKRRTMTFLSRPENAQTMLQDPHDRNSMTYIVAELSVGANPELVNQMRVTLIDAPLHRSAALATQAVIKDAQAARAQQEAAKAREQPTPKL